MAPGGLLLGVLEARYPSQTFRLRPGDKLLFYSDGIDQSAFEDHPPGQESLVACAARHRHLPVQDLVARLTRELFGSRSPADDLTLLGLQMDD